MIRTIALCLATAMPAQADGFSAVSERSSFLALVKNKDLRIGMFQLTLQLSPEGAIQGSALGWDIVGTWNWQDGFFCRTMDWGGKDIPFNCQLVEARGAEKLRFTTDKGEGDSATFDLR